MDKGLVQFFSLAIRAMVEDLDTFVRASLKVSDGKLLGVACITEEELSSAAQVAMVLEVGEQSRGVLQLPLRAAICLGGSMMFLPAESVKELMELEELDEEGELTVHEVGNLLAGSLGRVAREQFDFRRDIRLLEVLFRPTSDNPELPFRNDAAVAYGFLLHSDRSEAFNVKLFLPDTELRGMFPTDPFWARHSPSFQMQCPPERTPPSSSGCVDRYSEGSGPQGDDVQQGPVDAKIGTDGVFDSVVEAFETPGESAISGVLPSCSDARFVPSVSEQSVKDGGPGDGSEREGADDAVQSEPREMFVEGSFTSQQGGAGGPTSEGAAVTGLSGTPPGDLSPGGRICTHIDVLAAISSEAKKTSSPRISLRGCHVLVVDGSWVVRRAMVRLLSAQGCMVYDARDVRSARQIVMKQHVDVILLDLVLPGENGLSFCVWLKSEGVLERMAVVIVSGSSTSGNVIQAIQLGASYFLVKPVDEDYLLRVLGLVFSYCRRQRQSTRAAVGG